MTIDEMESHTQDKVLQDVIDIYETIIEEYASRYVRVSATTFSLEKPINYFGFKEQ